MFSHSWKVWTLIIKKDQHNQDETFAYKEVYEKYDVDHIRK